MRDLVHNANEISVSLIISRKDTKIVKTFGDC